MRIPLALHCLLSVLLLSAPPICSGTRLEEAKGGVFYNQTEPSSQSIQRQLTGHDLKPKSRAIRKDELPPGTTVPIINPSPNFTPNMGYPGLPPFTPAATAPPTMTTPSSSGQVWCVASPTASSTALQVALDYACGYGGADCSAIQSGGSCFNPDTIRDHASYAFNSYYQKNPLATSCDFSGTAVITTTNPSTQNCQFPASSAPSNQLPPTTGNPTTPTTMPTTPTTTPSIYGIPPPAFGSNSGFSRSTSLSKLKVAHFVLLLAAYVANI